MKPLLQALAIMLLVGALAVSAYLFAEREYVHRLELEKLNKLLVGLREDLDATKLADSRQRAASAADTMEQHEKILHLQRTIQELQDNLQEWRGFKKQEEKASETLVTSHEKTRATLSSLQAELVKLREMYLSKDELPGRLDRALRAAVQGYHPLDITLGALPSGKPPSAIFKIPDTVPDTAHEILVYAYIATDFVKGNAFSFKLSVKTDSGAEAAFYLHAVADTQTGWAYNSDNVWLPSPADRELSVYVNGGGTLFGNWDSKVKIIAYR